MGAPAFGRSAFQSIPIQPAIVAATWFVPSGGWLVHSPRRARRGETSATHTSCAPSIFAPWFRQSSVVRPRP
jgi:hypothetical protein